MLLIAPGMAFWRGAADLHGHLRAGAQTIVEGLVAQARKGGVAANAHGAATSRIDALSQVHQLLPGLGEPIPVHLDDKSPAFGRSLAEVHPRGIGGGTVLAIRRAEEEVLVPTAKEIRRAGDILALAGTPDAVDTARAPLAPPRDEGGSIR